MKCKICNKETILSERELCVFDCDLMFIDWYENHGGKEVYQGSISIEEKREAFFGYREKKLNIS
jgi:hypothetical protein